MMSPHPILPGEEKIMAPTLEEALEQIAAEDFAGSKGISPYAAAANELTRRVNIARQALAAHREREGRVFDADLSSAKRADHAGERSAGWQRRCEQVELALSHVTRAARRVMDARDAFRSPDQRAHHNLVLEEAEAWIELKALFDPAPTTLSGPQSNEGEPPYSGGGKGE